MFSLIFEYVKLLLDQDHADSIPDKTDDMYIVMAGEDVLSDISCPVVVDPSMVNIVISSLKENFTDKTDLETYIYISRYTRELYLYI